MKYCSWFLKYYVKSQLINLRIATASKANLSCLPFQETRDERKLDRHKQQSDSMCKFYLGGYINDVSTTN